MNLQPPKFFCGGFLFNTKGCKIMKQLQITILALLLGSIWLSVYNTITLETLKQQHQQILGDIHDIQYDLQTDCGTNGFSNGLKQSLTNGEA